MVSNKLIKYLTYTSPIAGGSPGPDVSTQVAPLGVGRAGGQCCWGQWQGCHLCKGLRAPLPTAPQHHPKQSAWDSTESALLAWTAQPHSVEQGQVFWCWTLGTVRDQTSRIMLIKTWQQWYRIKHWIILQKAMCILLQLFHTHTNL